MRKLLFIIVVLLATAFLSSQTEAVIFISSVPAAAGEACDTKTDSQETTADAAIDILNLNTRDHYANKFTTASAYTLCGVEIYSEKSGSPTMNVTAYIYTDSADEPGSVVTNGTGETLDTSAFPASASPDWVRFDFASNPSLSSGVDYWLVLIGDNYDSSNFIIWHRGNAATEHIMRSDDGSVWANESSFRSMSFINYK